MVSVEGPTVYGRLNTVAQVCFIPSVGKCVHKWMVLSTCRRQVFGPTVIIETDVYIGPLVEELTGSVSAVGIAFPQCLPTNETFSKAPNRSHLGTPSFYRSFYSNIDVLQRLYCTGLTINMQLLYSSCMLIANCDLPKKNCCLYNYLYK